MTKFRIIRSDVFAEKKEIHLKLNKDTHAKLRAKLFMHNVAMQALFEEFAQLLVAEDKRATYILESFVMKKIRALIEGEDPSTKEKRVPELDHETLYRLMEKDTNKEEIG